MAKDGMAANDGLAWAARFAGLHPASKSTSGLGSIGIAPEDPEMAAGTKSLLGIIARRGTAGMGSEALSASATRGCFFFPSSGTA